MAPLIWIGRIADSISHEKLSPFPAGDHRPLELMLPTGDLESGSLSGRENFHLVNGGGGGGHWTRSMEQRSLKRGETFNWANGGTHTLGG